MTKLPFKNKNRYSYSRRHRNWTAVHSSQLLNTQQFKYMLQSLCRWHSALLWNMRISVIQKTSIFNRGCYRHRYCLNLNYWNFAFHPNQLEFETQVVLFSLTFLCLYCIICFKSCKWIKHLVFFLLIETFNSCTVSYLSVGVLYSGDVGVSEGAFNKAKDQRALSYPSGSKHHHPVVVTLLGHSGSWSPTAALDKKPVTVIYKITLQQSVKLLWCHFRIKSAQWKSNFQSELLMYRWNPHIRKWVGMN